MEMLLSMYDLPRPLQPMYAGDVLLPCTQTTLCMKIAILLLMCCSPPWVVSPASSASSISVSSSRLPTLLLTSATCCSGPQRTHPCMHSLDLNRASLIYKPGNHGLDGIRSLQPHDPSKHKRRQGLCGISQLAMLEMVGSAVQFSSAN